MHVAFPNSIWCFFYMTNHTCPNFNIVILINSETLKILPKRTSEQFTVDFFMVVTPSQQPNLVEKQRKKLSLNQSFHYSNPVSGQRSLKLATHIRSEIACEKKTELEFCFTFFFLK